jgi:lipopolysaccharide export LptBFGC system permease protein LptF
MKSVGNILLLVVVVLATVCNFTLAAKCSDHLLSMKADDFSEEDGSKYGNFYIILYNIYRFVDLI